MWIRPLAFAASLGLSVSLAGCFLDSGAFHSDGHGGAGGNAGTGGASSSSNTGGAGNGGANAGGANAGGTGGSSGAGGTGGTGVTTTTCSMDCDDHSICTTDSCDTSKGECVHAPDATKAGELVSNDDPNDCVKTVCDDKGGTTSAPEDSEVPMTDSSQCHDLICKNGAPMAQPKNEGMTCGDPITDVCQKSRKCVGGDCFTDVYSDGSYGLGCETLNCTGGMSSNIQLHDDKCGTNIPNNCTKPTCLDKGACVVGPEVAGASCYDGQQGQCNGTDTTCHH